MNNRKLDKVISGLNCEEYNKCPECPYVKFGKCKVLLMRDAKELLKEQQQIVRCKDCKWWDKKDESPYGYCHACKHGYSSPNWEIGIYRTYKGDWFCAEGERKET